MVTALVRWHTHKTLSSSTICGVMMFFTRATPRSPAASFAPLTVAGQRPASSCGSWSFMGTEATLRVFSTARPMVLILNGPPSVVDSSIWAQSRYGARAEFFVFLCFFLFFWLVLL